MNYLEQLKEKYNLRKGQAALANGKPEKAFHYFQKVLLINESMDNIFYFALSLMALHRYAEAESYFRKVYEEYPANDVNMLSLAECFMMQQKWDDAIKLYEKLFNNQPASKSFKLYLERAGDVVLREKYVKAKEMFNNAQAAMAEDKYDEALSMLKQANEYMPNDPNTLNNIGIILFKQKKYMEAYKYVEQAVTLVPDNKTYQKALFQVKRYLKK